MPVLTNERHERFCQGIAAGRSQTQAYIEAGFRCESGKGAAQSAHRLRKKPHIAERLAELGRIRDMTQVALQEKIEREVIADAVEMIRGVVLTKELVRARLLEIVERSMQHQPVLDPFGRPLIVRTRNGALVAACTCDLRTAIAALRLLGREQGMFTERHQLPPSDAAEESDEELNKRVLDKLAEIAAKQKIAKAKPG